MLRYSPGEWYAVVTPRGVALLAPGIALDVVDGVWTAMSGGDGLAAVLGGLVGSFGTSLSSLPPFAVVTYDAEAGEARIVVRGGVHAVVTTTDGAAEHVSGVGVTTWQERVAANPAAIELAVAGDDAPRLPIRDGVVGAGVLRWSLVPTEEAEGELVSALPVGFEAADAPEPVEERGSSDQDAAPVAESEPVPVFGPAAVPAFSATPAPIFEPSAPVAASSEPVVPRTSVAGEQAVGPEPLSADLEADPEPATEPEAAASVAPWGASGETMQPVAGETIAAQGDDTLCAAGFPATHPLDEHTTGYEDLLFGETRLSTVEDAAVRAVPPPPPPPTGLISGIPSVPPPPPPAARPAAASPESPVLGDHDGETISADQLAAIQARLGATPAHPAPPAVERGIVDAIPAGAPARGVAPVLILSSGERVPLERGAVVGRRPRAVRATGVVPSLVTVDSPNQDISRSHVELRAERSDVLAVDLDTTNGTKLLRLGAEPVRLHPGEPTLLVAGDRLDLGDGVVLSFEGLG